MPMACQFNIGGPFAFASAKSKVLTIVRTACKIESGRQDASIRLGSCKKPGKSSQTRHPIRDGNARFRRSMDSLTQGFDTRRGRGTIQRSWRSRRRRYSISSYSLSEKRMKRKSFGSSQHEPHRLKKRGRMKKLAAARKRDIATIAAKTDATIDFSDMSEVVDWSGAEIGRFYRPTKRPVTIRLDDDVIDWLKSYGRGYQTKANLLLRHAMESSQQATSKTG